MKVKDLVISQIFEYEGESFVCTERQSYESISATRFSNLDNVNFDEPEEDVKILTISEAFEIAKRKRELQEIAEQRKQEEKEDEIDYDF